VSCTSERSALSHTHTVLLTPAHTTPHVAREKREGVQMPPSLPLAHALARTHMQRGRDTPVSMLDAAACASQKPTNFGAHGCMCALRQSTGPRLGKPRFSNFKSQVQFSLEVVPSLSPRCSKQYETLTIACALPKKRKQAAADGPAEASFAAGLTRVANHTV
jgi:hypothetical protein